MNFEVFLLTYLHENPCDVKKVSEYFAKDEKECEDVIKSLVADSLLYMPKADRYCSTPAGMEYVKRELKENAEESLPKSIKPGMKFPMYVLSLSKDKMEVMGVYDRRLGRLDVYPVLPDAMCECGFGVAVIESHLYKSVMFFKGVTVTKNGKKGFFKAEGTDISTVKRELEFAVSLVDTLLGKKEIEDFIAELGEAKTALPTVTDGAHIALNEDFVLRNYFDKSLLSEKKLEYLKELGSELALIKEKLDSEKGLSKIPRMIKSDVCALC